MADGSVACVPCLLLPSVLRLLSGYCIYIFVSCARHAYQCVVTSQCTVLQAQELGISYFYAQGSNCGRMELGVIHMQIN